VKVAFFSTKPYDRRFFTEANSKYGHELHFIEARLTQNTSALAAGYPAICAFVNDELDAGVLIRLAKQGVKLIALRSAGFNNVDLTAAEELGLMVVRVPAYSPYAVAEHTLGLMLALNRKIHRAYNRVRDGNFSLEGFVGFDMRGKTVGIIGTGKIGRVMMKILNGIGCHILCYDPYPNDEAKQLGTYVDLPTLFQKSDIISLHCPLTPETHHIINSRALAQMKQGVMIINTSRGALIDTNAIIESIKSGQVGYLGLDVYEEEDDLFFKDLSGQVIQDDAFSRLLTFPNVLITGHQAFFTEEALHNIADTTLSNITEFEQSGTCKNIVTTEMIR